MPKFTHLNLARKLKQNGFYTSVSTVEDELWHYTKNFKSRTVLCNCDDDENSAFFNYFRQRFDAFGLKRLIGTHYESEKGISSYKIEIYRDINSDGVVNHRDVVKTPIYGNDEYPAGDFRSPECIELLKKADIVVTNPPFSLIREFISQLVEYNKKFLIIGKKNFVGFKNIFPLFKERKIWFGRSPCKNTWFRVPNGYDISDLANTRTDEKGNKLIQINGIRWFTNLKTGYKQKPLDMREVYYTPEKYPKYDNYDAINVDKVADIPCDYPGIMGVPLTFMDKYCPEQFEIVGISGSHFICDLNQNKDYSSYVGYHQNGKMNGRTGSTFGNCPTIRKNDMIHDYYRNGNEIVQAVYIRTFIKNQNPEWSKYRYKKIIDNYMPEYYVPALTGRGVVVCNQEVPNFGENFFSITPKRVKKISGTDIYYEKDSGYKPDTLKDLDVLDSAENSFKWSKTKTNMAPDYSLAGDFAPTFTVFTGFTVSKQL